MMTDDMKLLVDAVKHQNITLVNEICKNKGWEEKQMKKLFINNKGTRKYLFEVKRSS